MFDKPDNTTTSSLVMSGKKTRSEQGKWRPYLDADDDGDTD